MLKIPLRLRWGIASYDFDVAISGKCRDGTEFTIAATADQVDRWLMKGQYIQDVFPELSPDEREILVSGTSPAEFERLFGGDEP